MFESRSRQGPQLFLVEPKTRSCLGSLSPQATSLRLVCRVDEDPLLGVLGLHPDVVDEVDGHEGIHSKLEGGRDTAKRQQ